MAKKLRSISFVMSVLVQHNSFETCKAVYFVYVEPMFNYGIVLWHESSNSHKLFLIQKIYVRIILNLSCKPLFVGHEILTFPCLYILQLLTCVHSCIDPLENYKNSHNDNT